MLDHEPVGQRSERSVQSLGIEQPNLDTPRREGRYSSELSKASLPIMVVNLQEAHPITQIHRSNLP